MLILNPEMLILGIHSQTLLFVIFEIYLTTQKVHCTSKHCEVKSNNHASRIE